MANAEKGSRYLASLDAALCNGAWSDVPELARKVEKHASNRKCLTLAARSEAQIASASHRPTSAASNPTSIHGLSDLVPRLEEAVAVGNSIEEDAFVAGVCLAEIHWLREDHEGALRALPEHVPQANAVSSLPSALGWMEICGVKSVYIRASVMESQGKEHEARELYMRSIAQTPGSRTPELRKWTERMLAKACMYYHKKTEEKSIKTLSESLRAFGAWSDFWQRSPSATPASSSQSMLDIPRRQVWRAYYDLLSTILQYGLTYQISPSHAEGVFMGSAERFPEASYNAIRTKQRAELKRVEATYESLLINETQFPKANQTNREVEEWVEQAIRNWRIICGSGWTDAELGEGGKESVSRSMLEILYRAATKTFHSTAILRELMNVHASVGEFDLAMHAFDSYVEIVGRGKARAEKTGEHELGFDDDDTAVLTAVEAVRILCRYGDREQAEKALEVGRNIQKWLGQQRPGSSEQAVSHSDDNRAEGLRLPSQPTASILKPATLAAAYRAVGISQSYWAQLTYEAEVRPALQAEAIKQLQRSQAQDPEDTETAYALALLLAQTRDITAAIAVIRPILAAKPQHEGRESPLSDYSRERKLVPLWHLLALCLSAKDQHDPAMKMCTAAFEQFGDSSVLFGTPSSTSDPEKHYSATRGVVDRMDGLEKEALLQIKMTQLTFVELLDGPSAALDMTDELLSLYARLFGAPEQPKALKPPQTAVPTTPSKGGTLRSIAGSIRPKSTRQSVDTARQRSATTNGTNLEPPVPNGTGADGAPIAITVTNDDGASARGRNEHRHTHNPFRFRSSTNSNTRSRSRSAAKEKPSAPDTSDAPPLPPTKDLPATADPAAKPHDPSAKPDQPLKHMEHNAPPPTWPAPTGHHDQPPEQDVRLPVPHPSAGNVPEPRFPGAQQRRHRISVLVGIWIFIAELYVRGEGFEDAGGAVEEARKLVEAFELEVVGEGKGGRAGGSAEALYWKGWGAGKGVDALWGDVFCAKGDLASARERPFEAMAHYETALSHFHDHPEAIVALSNYLLDIYTEALPAEAPAPLFPAPNITSITPIPASTTSANPSSSPTQPDTTSGPETHPQTHTPSSATRPTRPNKDPTPAHLNRLAARERAHFLLSTLTRLGSGWDDSEAWLAMARVREVSGEVGKSKEALWWVVELEGGVGVRPWEKVSGGCGGAL